MVKIYKPDLIIQNLEHYSIYPFKQYKPKLGIILKQNGPEDEKAYFNTINKKAQSYGAEVVAKFADNVYDANNALQSLKRDREVYGIIILSSYGEHEKSFKDKIPSRLDVDCVSASTFGQLITSVSPLSFRMAPCTTGACYKIINDIYKTDNFEDLNIGIVNRSLRVGRPLAEILTKHNATVTTYNSHSKIDEHTFDKHDVVVVAVGKPELFDAKFFHEGQVVIDVGINVKQNGTICGDVDFESTKEILGENGIITPVPGCVGKLTTTILFSKLFANAAEMNGEIIE